MLFLESICSSGKVNSGERYPNRVQSFGQNRAYMKIRTPNSCCTDNTWFFEYFYGFFGFVVWEISRHFGGVNQSRYCASDGAFLFSFVYIMYLNISSYLCGKQIKSKLGNTMCLWMIFIFVHLKRLGRNECRTRTLNLCNNKYVRPEFHYTNSANSTPPFRYDLFLGYWFSIAKYSRPRSLCGISFHNLLNNISAVKCEDNSRRLQNHRWTSRSCN